MNIYTLIIFLSCFVLQVKGPGVAGLCHNGWTHYRSSCYRVVDQIGLAWLSARKSCQLLQADLVTVKSFFQNNFLKMLASFQAPKANYVWLGLRRNSVDNTFYWVHGTQALYTNWVSSVNLGDCVMMDLQNRGKWMAGPCLYSPQKGPIIYMCEK